MHLEIRTETIAPPSDMRWLGSDHGVDTAVPVELDLSKFDLAHTFVDGYIPAGVVIARIDSSGRFGAYSGAVSEVVTVEVENASGGTFTLTFQGETTTGIAYNATAAAVKAALEALPGINLDDFFVEGDTGGPWTITANPVGQYGGQDIPAFSANAGSLTGEGADVIVDVDTTGAAQGATAGLEVARFHLLTPVVVGNDTTGVRQAAGLWHGRVIEEYLPTGHGLDERAKQQLSHIFYT